MQRTKLQLSIPEPCHQNWDTMTPTQQGRFCNACARQVVDFSLMSDAEVLNYFSNLQNEKVCGRVYPDQLERAITMPAAPKKKLFWQWHYITMLFLFFGKSNSTKAQGSVKVKTDIEQSPKIDINAALQGKVRGLVLTTNKLISGKVIDADGNPIPFASIRVKGNSKTIAADGMGAFLIEANVITDVIEITSTAFNKADFVLKGLANYIFVLSENMNLTGEVVISNLVGAISFSNQDYNNPALDKPLHVAVLEVKDNATLQPVKKATITISKNYSDKKHIAATDDKGIYKLRRIKDGTSYSVKVSAEGYLDNEFKICGEDFDERKMAKQIFLEKAPIVSDYKKLDSVVVSSYGTRRLLGGMTGGMTVQRTAIRTFTDSIKLTVTKLKGDLKIFPNPVTKGTPFNFTTQLKQTGKYNIQIIDAAGRVIMQKQSNAAAKKYVEQVQTSDAWGSGVYYISIFDSNNTLISTNNFIVQ